ncbi:MAG: hypothetical protein KUG77_18100 [Nannocystaceae bacterium]|nr:hypothetical protein [Nannocystaceae bacterium]
MTDLDLVYAEVDVSHLPQVNVLVVGPLTERGFATYLAELLESIQLRPRVTLRLHAGSLSVYPPRYVRKSVAWMKRHEPTLTRHIAAVAIVMDSAVVRVATQAIVWAARPAFPMVVKQSPADADDWLQACLQEEIR